MSLPVAAFEYSSTIDWYGKSSFVIFTEGCNLRCVYCQNHGLIPFTGYNTPFAKILNEIEGQLPFIDAIVFTGGEPTAHPQIVDLCCMIKERFDIPIMIDTNGTYPEVIQMLLEDDLIDRVALDIKTRLNEKFYDEITGVEWKYGEPHAIDKILVTIKSTYGYGKELEIRTTIVPGYNDSIYVIDKLAESISLYANDFMLQQCIMDNTLDKNLREKTSPSRDDMLELAYIAKQQKVKNVYIKTKEKGLEKI